MTDHRLCKITGQELIPLSLHQQIFGIPETSLGAIKAMRVRRSMEERGVQIPAARVNSYNLAPRLPKLRGNNIVDHMENLGAEILSTWQPLIDDLKTCKLLPVPSIDDLVFNSGWTRYAPGEAPQPVSYPLESSAWYDTETLVKLGNYPVMAGALSSQAWYVWLHPAICDSLPHGSSRSHFSQQLIPIGEGKLYAGHNISFDRIQSREEYTLGAAPNRFLDTMSMHQAIAGLSNQQRAMFKKVQKAKENGDQGAEDFAPEWTEVTSMANLVDCYNHHVKPQTPLTKGDKTLRDIFVVSSSPEVIWENRYKLVKYCLLDVRYTAELFQRIYPKFVRSCPSKVTLAAALATSVYVLPLDNNWQEWIHQTELTYRQIEQSLEDGLEALAKEALGIYKEAGKAAVLAAGFTWGKLTSLPKEAQEAYNQAGLEAVLADPWLRRLDWRNPGNKGLPYWARLKKGQRLGFKSRCTPYLLRLTWQGQPMVFTTDSGWCYLTDSDDALSLKAAYCPSNCYGMLSKHKLPLEDIQALRVPHKDGDTANCGNPLGKDYISLVENGTIGSASPDALEMVRKASSIAYWTAIRSRIHEQRVIEVPSPYTGKPQNITLPYWVTTGTFTRRSVERLWLTVSSTKPTRVGSEAKSRVQVAPDSGMVLYGADYDAQEMRIAGMFADSYQGVHGTTPFSYTLLAGNKDDATDIHSLNARIADLERDDGKVVGFAVKYGARIAGLTKYIKTFRKDLTTAQCKAIATRFVTTVVGTKVYINRITQEQSRWKPKPPRQNPEDWFSVYVGGTDSEAHNKMEEISSQPVPRSPILGAAISEALRPGVVKGDYQTSRDNWTIQTSGKDLLDLWVVAFEWLRVQMGLECRLMISFHDEIWVMGRPEDQVAITQAFQCAHAWCWAYACLQLGLEDMPSSVPWFSGVNVDTVWRKNHKTSQISPSNKVEPPPGIELKPSDIWAHPSLLPA